MIGLEEIKEVLRSGDRLKITEMAIELYNLSYYSANNSLKYEKEEKEAKARIEYIENRIKDLENEASLYAKSGKNEAERRSLMYEFLKGTSHKQLVLEVESIKKEIIANDYIKKKYKNEADYYENVARILENFTNFYFEEVADE
jgi:hypothetical protein